MRPIYTAFYTAGTMYEHEAARLRRSLDRLSLEHDIRAVADRGSWVKNTQLTARHIRDVLHAYPTRPVVQLDADAVVWHDPVLFDEFADDELDVAVHYRRGVELLNGTVYLAPTPGARLVADLYLRLITENPECKNEQTMLDEAIKQLNGKINLRLLPPEYCWIHDIMAMDLPDGVEPVIEHLQASRSAKGSPGPHLDNRLRRLAEIGG